MGVHPLIPETSASANSAIPATQDKSYNSILEKARLKKPKIPSKMHFQSRVAVNVQAECKKKFLRSIQFTSPQISKWRQVVLDATQYVTL